ncbi:FAD:protein FMN transferase [Chachezhania sediminis]|uniref:FAD:protein FMN transferase n=1 Tax=Chachezhania sediminis TaxID=2599291 RepID=UPI00131B1588|nr:FAD:protein FMN transferase [Chachezhania sediminis]
MSKMSTDLNRHALNGPTMGTRWSALFFMPPGFDPEPVRLALQAAVEEVDAQMSTWRPDSALMRLNAAPVGDRVACASGLIGVLRLGVMIGQASAGAFDIGLGDAVTAWGFGPDAATPDGIRRAMSATRRPASETLVFGETEVCKTAPIALDLNGIAKGHGVDRLAETLRDHGITQALVGIDGEMRALGLRPDGTPWSIAVEAPDAGRRSVHSVVTLEDAAIATSGDYRHWVEIGGKRLSHTMDPARGAPLVASPASVTVVAATCATADAWATALMVLGVDKGTAKARAHGLDALFLVRKGDGTVESIGTGPLFGDAAVGAALWDQGPAA